MLLLCISLHAQRTIVAGNVYDQTTKQPIELSVVQLLKADSTFVDGVSTDSTGLFKLTAPAPGTYIVKATFTGYTPSANTVSVAEGKSSVYAGKLYLEDKSITLQSAVAVGTASLVEQKADTTLFNAAAYRTPVGSTLESLVKQLPGVDIDDSGKITWNGKEVKEFLVNGKDFFKGDTQTAMKNLPVELVSKLKAYDKKSDYAEMTGIDDGEETTVLDIMTHRALDESWIVNADLGYGTHDRYSGRVFATRFSDHSRISVFGNANNTGDRGFGGPRHFRGQSQGLVASKMAGADFSWDNGLKSTAGHFLEVGGNVFYNHRSTDLQSTTTSEMFLGSGAASSFNNSRSASVSSSTNIRSSLRLKWNPDSLTNITLRPSFNHSDSKNNGSSLTATFNDNPFDHLATDNSDDVLDNIFGPDTEIDADLASVTVNRNRRQTLGDSKSNTGEAELNVVRKLGRNGRNISLRLRGGITKSESNNFTQSHIRYFADDTPASFLNQYSTSPEKNWNASANVSYVEPIVGHWLAEVRYGYEHKFNDRDRSRYNLERLGDALLRQQYGISDEYAAYGLDADGSDANLLPIGSVPTEADVLMHTLDAANSQYATYNYNYHRASLGVRYNSKAIQFNASMSFNPEHTSMAYANGQINTTKTRSVFNVAPFIRLDYKFNDTDRLEFRYRGSSSQPSMTNLLAVVDDSDPLNVSMGNPALKPAWQHFSRINYNAYNAEHQRGIMAGADFSTTRNSISSMMVYDQATGVRYTRPENISGNWNANARFMINSGLGAKKLFTVTSFSNISYTNNVGYISTFDRGNKAALRSLSMRAPQGATGEGNAEYYNSIFENAAVQKNTTRTLLLMEHFDLRYRNSWFDVGLNGRVNYQHARANLQENANMDTWNFSYGASANFNFDWGMSLSTDFRVDSRRGYSESAMNTNEMIWNVQLAQSFLRSKNLTVSLQWYDILQKQSNISRTINAQMRSDSWNNAINAYFMVHLIYKLTIFPSGKSESDLFKGRDGGHGFGGRGPVPGGMPHGGFGGGMGGGHRW